MLKNTFQRRNGDASRDSGSRREGSFAHHGAVNLQGGQTQRGTESEWGAYPIIERYNLHTALAPRTVDVVVIASGEGKTTLVLDILAVVGVTNWAETEGITDLKLLEESKTTLSSFYRFEQPVVVHGRSTFTINDVSLKTLVETFSRLQFWPRQVIFRAGLLPIEGEKRLANNINQFDLILDPPD
jgi:hypothetical protein